MDDSGSKSQPVIIRGRTLAIPPKDVNILGSYDPSQEEVSRFPVAGFGQEYREQEGP